jgi:hypothetical protein
VEFQNSDRFAVGVNQDYEYVPRVFTVVPGARVPVGGYEFTTGRIGYNMVHIPAIVIAQSGHRDRRFWAS